MSTASAAFKTISRSTTGLPPFIIATGGTEYLSGGYKYHEFTSSGTFVVKSIPSYLSTTNGPGSAFNCIDIMLVGGGGGAAGAGGGAGGYVFIRSLRLIQGGNYEVVIGSGGLGTIQAGASYTKGGDTAFGRGVLTTPLTALGGGAPGSTLKNGGSGAGSTTFGNQGTGQQPSSTTGGLGNDGGASTVATGGGGAGTAGGTASGGIDGSGGKGVVGDLPNNSGFYGYSNSEYNAPRQYCRGGSVGGGTGNQPSGSGWGGSTTGIGGYNGGSGVVILRYPSAFIYNQ